MQRTLPLGFRVAGLLAGHVDCQHRHQVHLQFIVEYEPLAVEDVFQEHAYAEITLQICWGHKLWIETGLFEEIGLSIQRNLNNIYFKH